MHLETKETRITDLKLAKPVEEMITALPNEVALTDEDVIVAARSAYEALEENIKLLITNLDRLDQKEEELLAVKNPDLAAINKVLKTLPTQIVNDYVFPTSEETITWAYKEGEDTSYFDIEAGQILKTTFGEALTTLVATKGEVSVEVEINFGLVYDDQTAIFYSPTKPAAGNTWDGFGTYDTQLAAAGFGGVAITVGNKVYFISKDAHIKLTGTVDNEVITRTTLRPLGISALTDLNNNGLKKGVATSYSGAGALYHNTSDVTITFNASNTYGRLNVPTYGFAKVVFKANADGTHTVQQGLAQSSSDGNAVGEIGDVMVVLEPGDMLWTPHSWEIDYVNEAKSSGYGTKLHQNYDGVLAPNTVITIKEYKMIEQLPAI